MGKSNFHKNSLYYLLMEHAGIADQTDGEKMAGLSVDQMFDEILRQQEEPEPMKLNNISIGRGKRNEKD
jgi:hypothetical protein